MRAQRNIEMQTFKNSMLMTDSNNSALRCLKHILNINLKLLHVYQADHFAFIIKIQIPFSFDIFHYEMIISIICSLLVLFNVKNTI